MMTTYSITEVHSISDPHSVISVIEGDLNTLSVVFNSVPGATSYKIYTNKDIMLHRRKELRKIRKIFNKAKKQKRARTGRR